MNDVINHPSHYCRENAVECLDEMEEIFGKEVVMHFCLCNVWKYRYRACDKNGEEDLKKSDFYMKKYLNLKKELEPTFLDKLTEVFGCSQERMEGNEEVD